MVQVGVFLIPPAEHPFYRVVSDILGYDVLARREVPSSLAGHLDPARLRTWLGRAPEFGTHCTITGGDIVYDDADLDEIKARLAWIAGRVRPFTLVNGRFYDDFHAVPKALVTRFDSPDGGIDRLHRLAATIISPLHVDTRCSPPRDPNDARARELYIRTGEAWALERFAPHWTLMSGLPDQAAWEAARELIRSRTGLFADDRTRTLEIADVHLVRHDEDGSCSVAASFPLTGG
jgi:hypothetical protein